MTARDHLPMTQEVISVFCSLPMAGVLRMLSLLKVNVSEDKRAWDEEMV